MVEPIWTGSKKGSHLVATKAQLTARGLTTQKAVPTVLEEEDCEFCENTMNLWTPLLLLTR